MKTMTLNSFFILAFCLSTYAQDTNYLYFNKHGNFCSKDTAFYYARVFKDGELWARHDFQLNGNIKKMEGTYRDKDCKTKDGSFKLYNNQGILDQVSEYKNGRALNTIFYYENGNKKSMIKYDEDGYKQIDWDLNGKATRSPLYHVEVEAKFPGGEAGWQQYLNKNVDFKVAANTGAPAGLYRVKVEFVVDKEGAIHNVKAVSVPKECKACGEEAVRAIKQSPPWQPATLNGKAVIYRSVQYINFMVREG